MVVGGTTCIASCPIGNETDPFAITGITLSADGFPIVSFESCTDHVYIVYSTDSLTNSVWNQLETMPGLAGTTTWTDLTALSAGQRFYKVLRLLKSGGNPDNGVDSDGDGFTDAEEILLGTDPNNSSSHPGASVNESLATNLIYVATSGSDANPGTAVAPFLTIQKASIKAQSLSLAGIGSTIIIQPGIYRESIAYTAGSGNLLAPVVFQAAANGVVISGTDAMTNGWSLASGFTNVYQHAWANNWGLAPLPSGWPTLQDIVRRREMVFVNGNLLTQVLTLAGMTNGTYFVDDMNQLLYVRHRAGVAASNAFYEVAERSNVLTVSQTSSWKVGNVVLRGLEFRGAATPVAATAVQFSNAGGLLIDQCTFDWNNWSGMSFSACSGVTIRATVSSQNGTMGIEVGFHEKNIVYDRVQTCFNNWRGWWGGFTGFSIGGSKCLNIHTGLFRDYLSANNLTRGMWFDFDNQNLYVERCSFTGNAADGLFFEASQGPIRVEECVSTRNVVTGSGNLSLLWNNTQSVTVTNCALIGSGTNLGNGDSGSLVGGPRTVTNWETGGSTNLNMSNWTFLDNAFRCALSTQWNILLVANYPDFIATVRSDNNHFSNPGINNLFSIGGTNYTLSTWRTLTGEDAHSDTNVVFVTSPVTQDTNIRLGTTNSTFGTSNVVVSGTQADGTGALDVMLMKFDLSGLTAVPRQAELQLASSFLRNAPVVFYVYRLTSDWDENATAPLAKPNVGVTWAAGAFSAVDYDSNPVSAGSISSTSGALNTYVDVSAIVRDWISGVSSNYGLAIIVQPVWNQPVNDAAFTNWKQFNIAAREAGSSSSPRIISIHR
jgi:hypothetical protein